MKTSTLLGQVLAAMTTLTAVTASAAPPDAARALVEESAKLLAQGRVPEACARLEESRKLAPQRETDLKLAACWERAGRNASAWALYVEVAEAEQRAGHAAREREARARAAAVEPRVARLTLVVQRPEAVPYLEIRRDGAVVAPAQWNVAVPVDPGPHVIAAAAPGRVPFQSNVEVSAGNVFLTVPELIAAAPAPGYFVAPEPFDRRPPRIKKERYSVGMMAGGIAMVVVGPVMMFGAALSALNLFGSSQHMSPGAQAVMAIGGVMTLGGIPLIVIGARRVDPEPAAVSGIQLSIGPGSFGVSGRF